MLTEAGAKPETVEIIGDHEEGWYIECRHESGRLVSVEHDTLLEAVAEMEEALEAVTVEAPRDHNYLGYMRDGCDTAEGAN